MKSDERANNYDTDRDQPHVRLSKRRRQVVTSGVLLGMFLAALEATVVGTAMPTIIASLQGLNRYSWIVSAYLLTATVTVPVWGRLSDLYGRRALYLAGVAAFLVGSALSGASQSITQLILFRAIQGLGAGALVPLSMTINGDIYTLKERARIQGLFSGVWGLASILGPLAGGFITDHWSWRWVFYINIPFGLAAAIVVGLALVEPPREKRQVIDYAGAFWLTVSITLLLLALVETSDLTLWTGPMMPTVVALTLISGYLFFRTEKRAAEPIVPLSLLRNRVVAVGSITSFMVGASMFGALIFIPLFVQGTMGGSATAAGVLLTACLLGWVIMAVVGGRLIFLIGYRWTILSGLILLVGSFVILTQFGAATPRYQMVFDVITMGAGMGLVNFAMLISMQNAVGRDHLGIATSLNQFSRSIGQMVGVAIMGTVMTLGLISHMAEIEKLSGLPEDEVSRVVRNASALIDPIGRGQVKPELLKAMQGALAGALHNVFLVGAIFAAFALLAGLWIPSRRPEEGEPQTPPTTAECEQLLMAEMTTIDPEHGPVMAETDA